MGEGLKLAEHGLVRTAFLIEKPRAGGLGEPSTLVAEFRGLPAQGDGGLRHGGEIDMRRDVCLAGVGQRVVPGLVAGKRAQGAAPAIGMVIFLPSESVVGPEHQAGLEAPDQRCQKRTVAGADLGAVTFREIRAQRSKRGLDERIVDFCRVPNQAVVRGEADPAFPPFAAMPLDEVKRQGVEKFVAKGDAWQRIGREIERVLEETDGCGKWPEGFALGGLQGGERFRNHIFEGLERPEIHGHERAEDIGGEGAVMCPAFDDPPAVRSPGFPPFPEKPPCEQFAEQRSDAHAGEKIAVAADLAAAAGIVTQSRVIQRGHQEVREAQRAVAGDLPAQNAIQRSSCGGRPDGILLWALYRL